MAACICIVSSTQTLRHISIIISLRSFPVIKGNHRGLLRTLVTLRKAWKQASL